MSENDQLSLGASRALLTQRDREQIAEQHSREEKYQATSRARRRINEELATDVQLLEEYNPQLLDELQEVVCDEQ